MHKVLEECGGRASVSEIANRVSKKYNLSRGSVRQYAVGHYDFILENGLLRARNDMDTPTEPPEPDLGEVSGCLMIDDQPALRIPIDNNLWRGSGREISRAWAIKAGAKPGEKMVLGHKGHSITLSWLGKQPAIGSMRELAIQEGWPRKGFAFIILSETGLKTSHTSFTPEPSSDPNDAVEAISALFAMPCEWSGHVASPVFWLTLGERLNLPPEQRLPDIILDRLAVRRERLVAPFLGPLRKAWLTTAGGGKGLNISKKALPKWVE